MPGSPWDQLGDHDVDDGVGAGRGQARALVRAIEETRAAAGGVYVNTGPTPSEDRQGTDNASLVEQLTKLKQLLDNGVISDAEFQEMKSKIIARV